VSDTSWEELYWIACKELAIGRERRDEALTMIRQLLQEAQRIEACTPNLGDSYLRGRRSALEQVLTLMSPE